MQKLQLFTLVAGLLLAAAVPQARQAAPQGPPTPSAPGSTAPPRGGPQQAVPVIIDDGRDARETRERLRNVFEQYPPSVREVLRIDPTLLWRADYLATYPMLKAFLEQHPEVAHNPGYFIGETRIQEENRNNPAMEGYRTLRDMFEFMTIVLVVVTITTGIIWLLRTVVEQRRWQLASRSQAALHTKLIDRFASSDELLAYLQSPAGKILTETPVMPQAVVRGMDAPLNRIFWSLQSGIVLGALGTGLVVVSRSVAYNEFAQFLMGVGIVILMIGIGFAVSAAVSFLLSQRLGLMRPLSARYGGETSGP